MVEKKKSFEDSLKTLDRIVGQLEDGDLTLEESLNLFEEGIKLSRDCQTRLDKAERRIEILLDDENGNPAVKPIEETDVLG